MPCLSLPNLGNLGFGLAEGDGAAGIIKPLLTLRVAASAPGVQSTAAASSATTLWKSLLAVFFIFLLEFCGNAGGIAPLWGCKTHSVYHKQILLTSLFFMPTPPPVVKVACCAHNIWYDVSR